MAEISPFRGLRFDPAVVGDLGRVIAPPYDVISPAQQDELYARDPHNVVRLELARGAEPERYAAARRTLEHWRAERVLLQEDAPALYLHEHRFNHQGRERARLGFFCALRLVEWQHGIIRPHERTFSAPKQDRLALLRATGLNTSTIFLLHDDADGAVAGALAQARREPPLVACAFGEEAHRLWRVADSALSERICEAMRPRRLYVADGHHRYETALEHRRERPDAVATLAYLVAAQDEGLLILATHRVVRDGVGALKRASGQSFEAALMDAGALEDQQPPIALASGEEILALTPQADALGGLPEAWRDLPVAQAEELLLRDAREAGAEISYTHEASAALAAARGERTAAVLLRPVDARTLIAVADAGERLPQKTTYFYPKVPTGLVMRLAL